MLRRLKLFAAGLALIFCLAPALSAPASADTNPFQAACSTAGAGGPACNTTGADPISGRNGILYKVSRILSLVAGLGAVVVIIIGGFMYVTAAGDASKASNARRAIIGAVIGLIIIALSQVFIAFVINAVK